MDFTKCDVAFDADMAFWKACVKQFGMARAHRARHMPTLFDADTLKAYNHKLSAELDWQAYLLEQRRNPR